MKRETQIGAQIAIEVGLMQKLIDIKILARTSNFLKCVIAHAQRQN